VSDLTSQQLFVSHYCFSTYGRWAFSVAGPMAQKLAVHHTGFRSPSGNAFHAIGPATEKAQQPTICAKFLENWSVRDLKAFTALEALQQFTIVLQCFDAVGWVI